MANADRLTAREADVLCMLARGCTYTQIGDRLGVSENTVASHAKSIYRKLEVHSARSAVWRGLQLGLFGEAGPDPATAALAWGEALREESPLPSGSTR
jgi:DNA-binding NarL/FixJ family response regulator